MNVDKEHACVHTHYNITHPEEGEADVSTKLTATHTTWNAPLISNPGVGNIYNVSNASA